MVNILLSWCLSFSGFKLFIVRHNIQYAKFNKYFRENTEAILGRRLTIHALRHTHVALLAENGIPLDVISRRLGHADSDITKDIYFHVTKRMKEADNKLLKEVKIM